MFRVVAIIISRFTYVVCLIMLLVDLNAGSIYFPHNHWWFASVLEFYHKRTINYVLWLPL